MMGNEIQLKPIITAKYFYEGLAMTLSLNTGKNSPSETLSVHAFVVHGDRLFFALKQKVKIALNGTVTKELRDDLLGQYNSFCELVRKIKAVAADFRSKLPDYKRESDAEVRGS